MKEKRVTFADCSSAGNGVAGEGIGRTVVAGCWPSETPTPIMSATVRASGSTHRIAFNRCLAKFTPVLIIIFLRKIRFVPTASQPLLYGLSKAFIVTHSKSQGFLPMEYVSFGSTGLKVSRL